MFSFAVKKNKWMIFREIRLKKFLNQYFINEKRWSRLHEFEWHLDRYSFKIS